MYDRLAVVSGHLRKVGTGLTTAVNNYNSFVSSFEGRVLVTARTFRDLNIETGSKEIEDATPVDALAREPSIGREAKVYARPMMDWKEVVAGKRESGNGSLGGSRQHK